jgi:hypothetical protein
MMGGGGDGSQSVTRHRLLHNVQNNTRETGDQAGANNDDMGQTIKDELYTEIENLEGIIQRLTDKINENKRIGQMYTRRHVTTVDPLKRSLSMDDTTSVIVSYHDIEHYKEVHRICVATAQKFSFQDEIAGVIIRKMFKPEMFFRVYDTLHSCYLIDMTEYMNNETQRQTRNKQIRDYTDDFFNKLTFEIISSGPIFSADALYSMLQECFDFIKGNIIKDTTEQSFKIAATWGVQGVNIRSSFDLNVKILICLIKVNIESEIFDHFLKDSFNTFKRKLKESLHTFTQVWQSRMDSIGMLSGIPNFCSSVIAAPGGTLWDLFIGSITQVVNMYINLRRNSLDGKNELFGGFGNPKKSIDIFMNSLVNNNDTLAVSDSNDNNGVRQYNLKIAKERILANQWVFHYLSQGNISKPESIAQVDALVPDSTAAAAAAAAADDAAADDAAAAAAAATSAAQKILLNNEYNGILTQKIKDLFNTSDDKLILVGVLKKQIGVLASLDFLPMGRNCGITDRILISPDFPIKIMKAKIRLTVERINEYLIYLGEKSFSEQVAIDFISVMRKQFTIYDESEMEFKFENVIGHNPSTDLKRVHTI